MKLLIITQKVDENDDLLGFFVDWIREFSKKFEEVSVITLAKGVYSLPANVKIYSLGKEENTPKAIRFLKFYYQLFRLAPKTSAIFAHMSPIFVLASWPVAFIFRKKIILWYLHRSVTFRLKLAEKLSYKIVTAAKESLKFNSSKIVETGHGIDISKFVTSRTWEGDAISILSVGRISKIKNFDILLKTAEILKKDGLNFKVKIVGQPVMPPDFEYQKSLLKLMEDLRIADCVEFCGLVPHNKTPEYYKNADIVVGLTPDGGIDKTILEGMACGAIVLTSNNACGKYFGNFGGELIFNYRDPADLASKIKNITSLSRDKKIEISNFMIDSVSKHHRLENTVNAIHKLL